MKDHFLKELLDAATSTRRHFTKPRKIRKPGSIENNFPKKQGIVSGRYESGLKVNILTRFWRSRIGCMWDEIWKEVVSGLKSQPVLLKQVRLVVGGVCKHKPGDKQKDPPLCWVYGGRRGATVGQEDRHIVFFVCPKSTRLMVLPRLEFHHKFGTGGGRIPMPHQ